MCVDFVSWGLVKLTCNFRKVFLQFLPIFHEVNNVIFKQE